MEFGLPIMHPLFTSNFRIKILKPLLIIALPAMIFLYYIENGLNKIDTHYLKKRVDFESQLNSIEILSLGSSNAYFGINPSMFSCKGYNLAFNAQSMYYDLAFAKKYLDLMPNLKLVILPSIFFTTGTQLIGSSQDWRVFFYKQYFSLPNETVENDLNGNIKRIVDARNYSKIALFADNIYTFSQNDFIHHIDYIPQIDGWYNSKDVPRLTETNNQGTGGAIAHSMGYDLKIANKNISYWQEIIEMLQKKGVNILILHLPEDSSYYLNLDNRKLKIFTESINDLALKNNITFANYTMDKRFSPKDFTLMSDHLNNDGATKFSSILNYEYLNQYCKNDPFKN
jgi:hypothetical protein